MDRFLTALNNGDWRQLWEWTLRFGPQFVGGAAGFGIVAGFLAARGGDWSREEDVQLLLMLHVAIGAAVVISLAGHAARYWPRGGGKE